MVKSGGTFAGTILTGWCVCFDELQMSGQEWPFSLLNNEPVLQVIGGWAPASWQLNGNDALIFFSQQSGVSFFFLEHHTPPARIASDFRRHAGVFWNRLMGLKCFIFKEPTTTSSCESHVSWICHGCLLPGPRWRWRGRWWGNNHEILAGWRGLQMLKRISWWTSFWEVIQLPGRMDLFFLGF